MVSAFFICSMFSNIFNAIYKNELPFYSLNSPLSVIQCYRWTGKIGERTGVFPFNYVEAVGGGVSEEVSKEAEVNCPFFDCHLAQVFPFHQA